MYGMSGNETNLNSYSYFTSRDGGYTSSFKQPVFQADDAPPKGLRHLTKIIDQFSSVKMEESALAIIEEKKLRIRR